MTGPVRATADVNFLWDLLDANRGHREVVRKIVDLHPGEVEIKVSPQGLRLDVSDPLRQKIEETMATHGIEWTPQVSRLTAETRLGFHLGHGDQELVRSWDETVNSWPIHLGKPPGYVDCLHIESHMADSRTFFVTRDRPLREMCRLLEEKGHGPIGVVSPYDFLDEFSSSDSVRDPSGS